MVRRHGIFRKEGPFIFYYSEGFLFCYFKNGKSYKIRVPLQDKSTQNKGPNCRGSWKLKRKRFDSELKIIMVHINGHNSEADGISNFKWCRGCNLNIVKSSCFEAFYTNFSSSEFFWRKHSSSSESSDGLQVNNRFCVLNSVQIHSRKISHQIFNQKI